MENVSEEHRRALETLARHPNGCAEAVLLGEGFSVLQLSGLVIDGYATLHRKWVGEKTVLWMEITEAGRKAIAE
jgi:hypothetical protein